jgi:hypothetical protein
MISGRYRWFSKHIAYRNDYCLSCKSPQIANQYRTFDFIHFYYIPVIPLGFWRHWHCTECSKDPHRRGIGGRWVKIVGAVFCALFAAIYWLIYWIDREDSSLLAGLFFTVLVGIFIILSVRHKPGPRLEDELLTLPPLDDEHCHYCGGDLWGTPLQCVDCHLYQL